VLDTVIRGCSIATSGEVFKGWLGITDGLFAAIGSSPDDVPNARRVIDADGLTALPGRIEPHLHLLGTSFDADVREASRQAAAGGTTTLMPMNRATQSYHELYPSWREAVKAHSLNDFVFQLQIQSPAHIEEIPEYRRDYGTPAFKLHLDYRVHDPVVSPLNIEHLDDGDLYLTMLQVSRYGGFVSVHCENTEIALRTTEQIRATGRDGLLAWAEARPPICEATDIDLVASLASQLGCRAHVVHLSSGLGLARLSSYSATTLTAETIVPFLTMTAAEAEGRVGNAGKMIPPLRHETDVDALWGGVTSGRVQTVGTDHVLRPAGGDQTVWDTPVGSSSIEFAVPLLITFGVMQGRLSLPQLSSILCERPARLYGLAGRKRGFAVGGDADLSLIDLSESRRVSPSTTLTAYPTPVDGLDLTGWPVLTMLRGVTLFERGQVASDPVGEVLRSEN
jgi:dihydroorotase-like cyclic amidohydrolase